MTPKRILIAAGALALAAVLAIGLVQLADSPSASTEPSTLTLAQMQLRLRGSPARLESLHAQAGELLGGGESAIRSRLRALRGYPVVINKWASWCEDCRAEIGAFQRASITLGRKVAFIGIDSGDPSRAAPTKLLLSLPLSYPSYYDPSGNVGEALTDSPNVPVTVFFDSRGSEYIQQGAYPSAAKLERDIKLYALDA